jgi:hypothetical protein
MASKRQKKLLSQARAQFRTYRVENPEEFEDQPFSNKRKIEWNEESPDVDIHQIREDQRVRKNQKRAELRSAKDAMRQVQQELGPKVKIEFSYEPGELVRISEKAYKRYSNYIDNSNLYVGAMGVIVEQNDQQRWNGNEVGRYIQVMGPNGLQQWNVAWVSFVEEESDEEE